jgi:hypothetical protein
MSFFKATSFSLSSAVQAAFIAAITSGLDGTSFGAFLMLVDAVGVSSRLQQPATTKPETTIAMRPQLFAVRLPSFSFKTLVTEQFAKSSLRRGKAPLKLYHKEEFANARENYYTEGELVRGEWQGQLAARWGLEGEVQERQFARLAEGQHPETGEQLVRHQTAREYVNAQGETVRTMEHRAGWDATFSAPKSVSLTALVGGDDRVCEAHRESVRTALDEMEKYAQARIGGNVPAQTTGQWAAAKLEHDSSRPVNGYAAPQLHTHAVIFRRVSNTATQPPTRAGDGKLILISVPECRNWQTNRTQNPAHFTGRVGSSPTSGTNAPPDSRFKTRRTAHSSRIATSAGKPATVSRIFGHRLLPFPRNVNTTAALTA